MRTIRALIFDVDGTLADTEEVHRRAFNKAFREFDLDWDWTPQLYEELLSISGGRERITYYGADLATQFHHREEFTQFVRELHDVKTRMYASMLENDEVPLRTGVKRLIIEARDAGLDLAIATSSKFSNLKTLLDRNLDANWADWFKAIATCDTIVEKKPSSAVYAAVLESLQRDPAQCLAIEDTVNGCLAASGAGLTTLITTHFFTRHHHFPSAALVLDGLGADDAPFKVLDGSVADGEATVTVELLDRLVREHKEANAEELTDRAQIATV